jgi:hypothetical protein
MGRAPRIKIEHCISPDIPPDIELVSQPTANARVNCDSLFHGCKTNSVITKNRNFKERMGRAPRIKIEHDISPDIPPD